MNNMRLRALSLLLCLALVLPMLPIPASGALDATVSIESVEEFLAIMDDPDGSYRLDADLDLGNVLPLGYDPATGQLTAFTGSLDGNGHTLYYSLQTREDYPNAHTCGLFAYLDGAEIFNPCMRAHVVTFLWRAVGSPEPTSTQNPFVDIKPGDFYYKPVLWALENGITSGVDATHFAPSSYCNRAQVVTFLYRSLGSPALESAENPFTDVAKGSFYERAVLWAVKNGITNGTSATTFGPGTICNRAQIVTFLYRAFAD